VNLKDLILAAEDCPLTQVEVPEWGATVYLRPLTARERDRITARAIKGESDEALSIALVGRCLCDIDGRRVFADGEIEQLGAKSGAVVERLFGLALDLNGMGAKAQESLAKN
jgi:hypothetical protein